MKRIIITALTAVFAFSSTACSAQPNNIKFMNETKKVDSPSNIRDFEENGWSNELMMCKPPFPVEGDNNTVTTSMADGYTEQSLYLWNEGNVPATTTYTVNNGSYYDDPDFISYITSMLVPETVQPKGAVLLCAGGAFAFRGDYTDSIPTAEELNKLGYQCFIVDYRLHPYTQQEGALDLQRAVRFVRKNADIYRINPNNIAVAGFSAGGIQAGEQAMNFKGDTNGTKLDSSYIPDELDSINADVAAVGIIYSFYGRLSVAEVNVETLRSGNLPPTYVCYGTNEVFRGQIENQIENHIEALKEAGVTVGVNMLEGYSHGFGANGNWCGDFDEFLMSSAFEPLETPVLELEDITAENSKIKFSVNTNVDTANIIVALYDENGVLTEVKTNVLSGEFDSDGGKTYSMKAFAWKWDTLEPITSSSVKTDITTPASEPVTFEPFTTSSKIDDVINDDAFGNYGRLLFPADTSYYSGDTLGNLRLTWYNGIKPDKTVEICNYMKDQALSGKTIFYDIYTDAEKAADSAKANTGLFFFKGDENAKFAIVNAGGGFAYVGAMHDSFPHALELSKKGYNAFALIYRPGWDTAMEDLARAIAFIHEHADELGVDTDDYSLWGGSAGARMAATLGSYTTDTYGEKKYPQPAAVIMQYTGHSEVTGTEPPTYNCVGTSDGIASYTTMQNRIDRIKANGTDTMIEIFDGLPHGFGLGEGTVAYGWLDNAVEFWERNTNK